MPWSWSKLGDPFTHHSDRFLDVDRAAIPWDALAAVPERDRPPLARSWTRRAHDEYRSMVAFAELLKELTEIAAPLDVIGCAARVVRDEARHVEWCARLATALGGPAPDVPDPRWVRSDPRRPARDRVAYTMVASMAIGETLSVASFAAARERTRNPALHAVETALLADEAFHSRFGLAWVEAHWRKLPLSTRLYVESSLPSVFARLESEELAPFRGVFHHTLSNEILPRLDAAGVRAGAAWERRSCAAP